MMSKAISFVLLLSAILYSDAEKKIAVKENKLCISDGPHDKLIKLGSKNQKVGRCKQKCLEDEQCVAMQFKAPKRCSLFYSPITKMKTTTDEVYCGRVKHEITEPEPEPPAPPAVDKPYTVYEFTTCGEINMEKATNFMDRYESQEECQAKCNTVKSCKAYQWNGKKNKCTIIKYRVKTESLVQLPQAGKKARVCGIVPKPTDSPTKAPTTSSTSAPTKASEPVPVETVECSLEVVLQYPFDDPDEANYYGYSTEYMVINEDGEDYYECSGSESIYYPEWLPDWCAYENSSEEENVDGATISNVDDYYDDYYDSLTQETITISNAAGMSFDINVHKWFYEQDYYTNYENWEDHMLAAVLTVKNLSHGSQTDLNADGWSKTVDINTPTHIENADGSWSVNEDHDDHFKVVVSCDNACLCEGAYFNDD